jgi:hypothetical protein
VGHADLLARRTERQADPPRQPVGTRQRALPLPPTWSNSRMSTSNRCVIASTSAAVAAIWSANASISALDRTSPFMPSP